MGKKGRPSEKQNWTWKDQKKTRKSLSNKEEEIGVVVVVKGRKRGTRRDEKGLQRGADVQKKW